MFLILLAGVCPACHSQIFLFCPCMMRWGDGWNDLSMPIGFTRYSPDSVRTRDRTTYSQCLNIAAKLPVGHDDTIIESFDIPCNLWPVNASLLFAGICIILHQKTVFFEDAW